MRTATQRDYEQRILRVLIHIQNHLDQALDLEELASVACFSPYHFHRIFRGMVGEPVKEHVRRLRLERAAHRLKTGDAKVTEVAFDAGYETHEAFARAFRSRFGQSPSRFREMHRTVPMVGAPCGVHYSPDGTIRGFEPLKRQGEEMDARIEQVDPLRVAFIRHTGPYQEVGTTWQQLCGWAGMKGLFGPQTKMFGACHDDPEITPPDKIRYDACIVVNDDVQAEGNVGLQTLAGRQYAVTTLCGPYSGLAQTYATLIGQWMPANGHEPAMDSPSLEFYQNDPNQTPADDLRTDVYVPIKETATA